MTIASRLTRSTVDSSNPGSLSARARAKRWVRFQQAFPDITGMRVLDLGGTPEFWSTAPQQPQHVTTVNIAPARTEVPWQRHLVLDACEASGLGEFDLVFSNSLLEHVGGHVRREALAEVISTSAPRYWVQTPYRYFPVEPHWLAPGFQWLPMRARIAYSRRWPVGNFAGGGTVAEHTAAVMEVELVGFTELRHYFPEATIWAERFAGIPKSLVAIKGSAT